MKKNSPINPHHHVAPALIAGLSALLLAVLLISGKVIAIQDASLQLQRATSRLLASSSGESALRELLRNNDYLTVISLDGNSSLETDSVSSTSLSVISGSVKSILGGNASSTLEVVRENGEVHQFALTSYAPFHFNIAIAVTGGICIILVALASHRRLQRTGSNKGGPLFSDDSFSDDYHSGQYPAGEHPTSQITSPTVNYQGGEDALYKKELELARESAVKASQFKSKLLSATSHELLTPLNSIIGFNELLKSRLIEHRDPLVQNYLNLVEQNAAYLNTLINDLVFYADREKSRAPLQYENTDIHTLVGSIFHSLEESARKKNLAYNANFHALKNISLQIDPVRLRQIIYNLIVNAIRYTSKGSVTLSASIKEEDQKSFLYLSVEDTGEGIDDEMQKHIFSAMITNSDTWEIDSDQPGLGLGLGLTIASELTHMMGGTIDLESEVGKGSCFTITLPVHIVEIDPAPIQTALTSDFTRNHGSTPKKNLLVVDDTSANCYLIEQLLTNSHWQVYSANSATTALTLASDTRFDAFIVDIRMQPTDGYILYGQLREIQGYEQTPVIACTAHTSDKEFSQLIKTGFYQVLHKPVSLEDLQKVLESITDQPGDQFGKSDFFDSAEALVKAGDNMPAAKNIFTLLIDDLSKASSKFKVVDQSDFDTVLELVHKIHGGAALSGTTQLKQKAFAAEAAIKKDRHSTECKQALTELFSYIDDLLEWAGSHTAEDIFENNPDAS